jgi:glycosyltransferase involved in cell wall biosynthesis
MHVALNAQLLSFRQSYRSGGISRYSYHLLRELRALDGQHRFTAYVSEPPPAELGPTERFTAQVVRPFSGRPALRIPWEQLVQPLTLARDRADLHHGLAYAVPLLWPGPSVVTVYDLSFLRFPELFNRGNRVYLAAMTRLAVRRARRVITISEHARRECVALLGLPAEKLVVTYPAADATFRPLPPAEVAAFRARRGLPESFILYLGTLEPRKNLPTLVRAYAELRRTTRLPHRLVIAGGVGWQFSDAFAAVRELGLERDVLFPGYVPGDEQALWYNAAALFIYPSRYEGFGLPALEALACGVPTIVSNAASLPEVVGDAALQVDPNDPAALARAMSMVLEDPERQAALRAAGPARAASFTWQRLARQTVAAYESALGGTVSTAPPDRPKGVDRG